MYIIYRNHLLSLKTICKTLSSFPHLLHLYPSFSTVTTSSDPPSKTKTPFLVDYCVNTCGFSRTKAVYASKSLTSLHSAEQPDSVLSFFRDCGLSDSQTKQVISCKPHVLSANVEKSLAPKLEFLQGLGLPRSELAELLVLKPGLLLTNVEPFVNLLRSLLGSEYDATQALIKILKGPKWRSKHLVSPTRIEKLLQPNISTLRRCGVSDKMIGKLFIRRPNFILANPSRFKDTVDRVERMGIPHQSWAFVYAVYYLGCYSEKSLEAKFNLFKSFRWSEADILSAFARAPNCMKLSDEKILKAMNYFMKELEYESSYVARYPYLLSYSLEKRIIPRINVLRILESKELIEKTYELYTVACLSEKKFLAKYVHAHKETVPEVFQAYIGCLKELPSVSC